jgi:hypothetical protein
LRDLLTAIAIVVILVLAAALVAPYAVDWEGRRGDVEAALSQAVGAEVRTRGQIHVRLLPSPILSLANVTVRDAGQTQLSAERVVAELVVAPLLRGEFRFTDATLERPVVTAAVSPSGGITLPRLRLAKADNAFATSIAIERLVISDGTLTVSDGDRIHEITGISGTVKAQSLRGPWSVEGVANGQPLRIATGEMGDDGSVRIRAGFGGEGVGRFDADGLLSFARDGAVFTPVYSGKASFARRIGELPGEAGPLLAIAANVTSRERSFVADGLTLDFTGPRHDVKLTGSGRLDLGGQPEMALNLQGRRVDASELWPAILDIVSAADTGRVDGVLRALPMPLNLNLSLGTLIANEEEVTNIETALRWSSGRVEIERLAATLPGETTFSLLGGRVRSRAALDFRGHIALASKAPQRLALALSRFSLPQPRVDAMARLPDVALETDIVLSPDVLALRGFQLKAGAASMTGLMRYSPGEGARGRFDAQIAAEGVDIATLPEGDILGPILRGVDVGLAVDGQRISIGTTADAGRVRAKINTRADAIEVESLDVTDLAGVNLKLGGRVGADGGGRIDGNLEAERAGPVVALASKLGIDTAAVRFLPSGFADGRLKFSIAALSAGGATRRFSVALDGTAAEVDVRARLTLKGDLASPMTDADVVFAAADVKPVLARLGLSAEASGPLNLALTLVRNGNGERVLALTGAIGGIAVKTDLPLLIDRPQQAARFKLSTPDAAPLARAAGLALEPGRAVPLNIAVGIDKTGDNWRLKLDGAAGDTPLVGDVEIGPDGRLVRGGLALDRLALPALASLVALGPLPVERPGSFWPSARFAAAPELPLAGEIAITSKSLDLGAGFTALAARLRLTPSNDGVSLAIEQAQLGGGTVAGTLALKRLGGSAAVTANLTFDNVRIERLAGTDAMAGSASGVLRFGGSGESVAAIVANLSGAGSLRLSNFKLERLNAEAVQRVISSTRGDANALDAKRLQNLIGEQFGRSAFTAASVEMPLTVVGGVVRASPVVVDGGPSAWQGAVSIDLKSLNIDANGLLVSRNRPEGWTGMPPQVSLAWRGPLAAPRRDTDASALAASLAAIHLTKELERVEAMEAEMRRIRAEREKRDAEAKAEEEKRQREAALKAEEEKRQREAAAKAEEERRQREAALKAEQEKRQREAAAKAEEERRQREAALKAEEERRRDAAAKAEKERRRREAESRSERDALKALIEGTAPTGSQPSFKVPDIISPGR